MFGAHWPELIILLLAALVIFGPKRLPEIGGAMGKGIREFRKSTKEPEEEPADRDVHLPDKPVQVAAVAQEQQASHASTHGQEHDASPVSSQAHEPNKTL